MTSFEEIKQITEKLLKSCKILTAPVSLEELTNKLSLKLKPSMLDDDTSGMLIVKNGKAIIAFNHDHVDGRKRFTIAHEIGHFLLHYNNDGSEDLFLDKYKSTSVYLRSNESNREETEANVFAANLLMPEFLLKEESAKYDEIGEKEIEDLANKFKVSSIAMTYRLQNLDIVKPQYLG
ncbi:MAG: ImmA/IrrE family metallo-endopeptidase [Cyclobacteriaceae bacterium]